MRERVWEREGENVARNLVPPSGLLILIRPIYVDLQYANDFLSHNARTALFFFLVRFFEISVATRAALVDWLVVVLPRVFHFDVIFMWIALWTGRKIRQPGM